MCITIPIMAAIKNSTNSGTYILDPDPQIQEIVTVLKRRFNCHTALLYGSRARNEAGPVSDYDVVGIRRSGSKTRVAKKIKGAYWDLFVYPEKDLKNLTSEQMTWRNPVVLFEKGQYGRRLVQRIQKLIQKPFKFDPQYEIDVTIAWAAKQLDRIAIGDVHGSYRRIELQQAAIGHYFQIRRIRYWGPKAGLQWLKTHDPTTFKLFAQAYRSPANKKALLSLIKRVYKKI